MHSFTDLIAQSTNFTLGRLKEVRDLVVEELQTSGATRLVKALQMIQLQKVVAAVGMFSIFEAMLQERLSCRDGFVEARKILKEAGESDLERRFSLYVSAINVLKHGRGRSYDALLAEAEELPFRVKHPDEHFFCEGDVSEISTLVQVDDQFVLECAELICQTSHVLDRH